ncbi:CBS domain-containing protein [Egicoccus halophilus]|uniref:CBS domain-containing protein n=1 Tax=Egicoccus halophilus TaxID=1670830 RepID=A0A8J3EVM8_9ACTN|nr:CBS domain-containing protein [Egicoccus halophilus]GGI09493.1 hypothetical protein GCM10011354_34350 [Egicoccus halophilus]
MRTESVPVTTVVRTPVATIAPTATLEAAASALAAAELGLLVVLDPTGIRGVLSERDIVTAVADGADLSLERVVDHAVTDVLGIESTASLADAARLMDEAGVRHLLVTDRVGATIGVVSIRDVLAGMLGAVPA